MGVESMMSGASHDGIDSAAEPTVLSRPGTCVTSLLDVLEGSQRVARGASAAPSVAPSVAPSIAGDLNDDTRSEAGSVATLPPTDLGTWEKDSHTGVNAKDATDPGEPAPGEPRTVHVETPGGSRRGGARERRRGGRGRVWSAFQRARSRFTRGVRLGNRVRRHRDDHSGRRAQSSRGGDVPGRFIRRGARAAPHARGPPALAHPAG